MDLQTHGRSCRGSQVPEVAHKDRWQACCPGCSGGSLDSVAKVQLWDWHLPRREASLDHAKDHATKPSIPTPPGMVPRGILPLNMGAPLVGASGG